jgi:hypothetical protein
VGPLHGCGSGHDASVGTPVLPYIGTPLCEIIQGSCSLSD